MDRQYIDMHLVTDRYLQDMLSESEKAEFEERLTWDQELIDEVDLAVRLREGLRQAAAEESHVAKESGRGLLAILWSEPRYAAAASFMLAVALSALLFTGPFPSPRLPGGTATSTQLVPLAAVRGPEAQQVKMHASSPTILLIDVSNNYSAYRVTITRAGESNEVVWMQDDLQPTYLQMLAIAIPAGFLQSGNYRVGVEGLKDRVAVVGIMDTGSEVETYEPVAVIPFEAVPEH